jgi:F-type H+-transporting ATPase subunit b
MEILKFISTNEVIAQAASFLLLLFLLRIFAWKKILAILDDRSARISGQLKSIEDTKAEVEGLKSELSAKLSKIDELAGERFRQEANKGKEAAAEIKKDAHLEAQQIIQNARDNIKYELEQAKEDLKEKVIELTIAAAENVIQEKLTKEDEERLARGFLKDIDGLKLK